MTEEIKEEEGINKKELHQILIEQDWRFARLLIGLSLGVILFSFEIFKNSHSVCYDWTLPTSRICLFVSFLLGLGYLFFYKKELFAEAKKIDFPKEKKYYERKIKFYDVIVRIISYVLMISFVLGIIAIFVYAWSSS